MIQIRINSNAQAVLASLRSFPEEMARGIAATMDSQNQLTVGYIAAKYLSGPRPEKLGRVTSTLARSIHASKATVSGNRITSSIGTPVVYAPLHEYGFRGIAKVEPHRRRVKSRDVRGKVDGKRRKIASGVTSVRSFERRVNIPARPFIEPGIRDRAADYGEAISRVIVNTWNGRA